MSSSSLENVTYKMCLEIIYLIYMYKKDLALNNLQRLIYYKIKPKLNTNPFIVDDWAIRRKKWQNITWQLLYREIFPKFLFKNIFL